MSIDIDPKPFADAIDLPSLNMTRQLLDERGRRRTQRGASDEGARSLMRQRVASAARVDSALVVTAIETQVRLSAPGGGRRCTCDAPHQLSGLGGAIIVARLRARTVLAVCDYFTCGFAEFFTVERSPGPAGVTASARGQADPVALAVDVALTGSSSLPVLPGLVLAARDERAAK